MGIRIRLFAIPFAVASLLAGTGHVLAAPAPASVGNMKRIIVPEKGEPQVTIAPSGAASAPASNSSSPPAGVSNPVSGGVPVQQMIQGGVRAGGPGPLPLR